MIFESPHIKSYSLLELLPFGKAYITVCTNNNPNNALSIKQFIDGFEKPLLDVGAAYAYQKDSPQTKDLIAEDIRRGRAFMGIKTEALAKTYYFDATIAKAADIVLACIKKYGKRVSDLDYNKETEVIDKLVDDFENDSTVKAAIATLGLTAWVAELKEANKLFKQKYLERTQQYASQPSKPAHELRPLAIAAFETLELQIRSRAVIDDKGKYDVLIAQLNALTQQYDANHNRGGSSGGNATPPPNNG